MTFRIGILILLVLTFPLFSVEKSEGESPSVAVRVPQLSVFRSLREVCIQTGVTADIDFGAWEANNGTLDLELYQSRLAVRRSPALIADKPIKDVFASWCDANEGFTASVVGKSVHVRFQGAGELLVRHNVFVNAPMLTELNFERDEDNFMSWDTLSSTLINLSNKVSEKTPFLFTQLQSAKDSGGSWLTSSCWPVVKLPHATKWNDSIAQVMDRLTEDGVPAISVMLSTRSVFFAGVIGYNAKRSLMPTSEIIEGLKLSTVEFRKRYQYASALASRIDCVLELNRRILLDPLVINIVEKSQLISTLVQAYETDEDSNILLVLLLECMNPSMSNHISEVVSRQQLPIRKNFYFNTLPAPNGVSDPTWREHFTSLWKIGEKDNDPMIRAFAHGTLE